MRLNTTFDKSRGTWHERRVKQDELMFKPFPHLLANFIFVSVLCILTSNNEISLAVDYSNNTHSKQSFPRYVCNSNSSQRFFHVFSVVHQMKRAGVPLTSTSRRNVFLSHDFSATYVSRMCPPMNIGPRKNLLKNVWCNAEN